MYLQRASAFALVKRIAWRAADVLVESTQASHPTKGLFQKHGADVELLG